MQIALMSESILAVSAEQSRQLRPHFLNRLRRATSCPFCPSGSPIDAFQMIGQDHAACARALRNRYLKWISFDLIGYRTN